MKPTLIAIQLSGKKLSSLRVIALRLGLRVLVPTPEQMGLTLGELLENPTQAAAPGAAPAEELLVLCGLSSQSMDALLAALRQQKASIPLKAVLTETNRDWTPAQLGVQLQEERAALAAGQTAHQGRGTL